MFYINNHCSIKEGISLQEYLTIEDCSVLPITLGIIGSPIFNTWISLRLRQSYQLLQQQAVATY